jgi:D-beta-D-heptose 7-phosphate kinase/D-beta-D-heptose 1-phosphate adenosyltransferase
MGNWQPLGFPGGAANTAFQLKNFNVNVFLSCFYDHYAEHIFSLHGLDLTRSIKVSNSVPIKKRFYDNDFPVFRWDIEDTENYASYEQTTLLIEKSCLPGVFVPNCDVLILSDYDKGLFNCGNFGFLTKQNLVPTIVDPKGENLTKWKNCTVFKPNSEEAKKLSGKKGWKSQCKYFHESIECNSVVITQEGKGVVGSCISEGEIEFFEFKPKKIQKNVNSVIGAGDAFTAILGLAIAHGFSLLEAVEIAFYAGSIYVSKKHNTPILNEELLRVEDPIKAKFMMPSKERDYKLIMTNGCFDFGLTSAHVEFLQEAKSLGDKLVVAINSDASVCKLKGENRPIMSLEERMKVVAGLESVDFVVSFDEETPLELIKVIEPNLVVKGGDYKREDIVGYGIVPTMSSKLYEGKSTTEKLTRQLHQQRHQP